MFIDGRDNQIHQSPRGGKRGSGKWESGKGRKGERERSLAPEGRHVYRTRDAHKIPLKPQRGGMFIENGGITKYP